MLSDSDFVNSLDTIRCRVEWIYRNSQDAVNSNRILINLYSKHFGVCCEESITRMGRLLRQKDLFVRDIDFVERDSRLFDLNKNYFEARS